MPVHYVYLLLAIVAETIGTAALQASQQFTRPLPVAILVVAYGCAFFLLGLTLKVMPVGVVYAIWSGLGIVLIAFIGFVAFGQRLDFAGVVGIGLVISGVVVLHLFSDATPH